MSILTSLSDLQFNQNIFAFSIFRFIPGSSFKMVVQSSDRYRTVPLMSALTWITYHFPNRYMKLISFFFCCQFFPQCLCYTHLLSYPQTNPSCFPLTSCHVALFTYLPGAILTFTYCDLTFFITSH